MDYSNVPHPPQEHSDLYTNSDHHENRTIQERHLKSQNATQEVEEKLRIARAKWAAPAAVLEAAEFSQPDRHKGSPDTLWVDLGMAIKDSPDALDAIRSFAEAGEEEETLMLAAGFGMVAGIMYASMTGTTLKTRIPQNDAKHPQP